MLPRQNRRAICDHALTATTSTGNCPAINNTATGELRRGHQPEQQHFRAREDHGELRGGCSGQQDHHHAHHHGWKPGHLRHRATCSSSRPRRPTPRRKTSSRFPSWPSHASGVKRQTGRVTVTFARPVEHGKRARVPARVPGPRFSVRENMCELGPGHAGVTA